MASSFSSAMALPAIPASSNSPCAACKFLRRKCTSECVFAPYFPPDQPQKFANVHKVFGASNVTKLLNELLPHQREDAVNSLAYEAHARLQDPVYGCVGVISLLQHQLKQLQSDLSYARSELSKYINAGFAFGIPPSSAAAGAAMFVPPPTIGSGRENNIFRANYEAAAAEMGARIGGSGGFDGFVSLNMNMGTGFVGGFAHQHPRVAGGEEKTGGAWCNFGELGLAASLSENHQEDTLLEQEGAPSRKCRSCF